MQCCPSAKLCFHPSPNMERKLRNPCRALYDVRACDFCFFLSESVEKLEKSLGETSISLRWSVEVMEFVNEMHIKLLAFLKNCKLPISFGPEKHWLDQYMNETAAVLDLCNWMKTAIAGIGRYRVAVDFAIRKLHDESMAIIMSKIELERLEKEREQIMGIGKWGGTERVDDEFASLMSDRVEDDGKNHVMIAVKTTTYTLSRLLVSAFSSFSPPVPIMDGAKLHHAPDHLQHPTTSLASLVTCFHERVPGSGGVGLVEREMVEAVIEDLRTQLVDGKVEDVERLMKSVELLRERSLGLEKGVDLIGAVVDEVFHGIIGGRNEMLGLLKSSSENYM